LTPVSVPEDIPAVRSGTLLKRVRRPPEHDREPGIAGFGTRHTDSDPKYATFGLKAVEQVCPTALLRLVRTRDRPRTGILGASRARSETHERDTRPGQISSQSHPSPPDLRTERSIETRDEYRNARSTTPLPCVRSLFWSTAVGESPHQRGGDLHVQSDRDQHDAACHRARAILCLADSRNDTRRIRDCRQSSRRPLWRRRRTCAVHGQGYDRPRKCDRRSSVRPAS
jgi:hypothetical protein